jgi:hypothetical protein
MPIKGVNLCGARCRTKGGGPCLQPGMKNGRCKMHGGCFYKKEIHGRSTLLAKAERKKEHAFLREMKTLFKDMIDILNENQKRP